MAQIMICCHHQFMIVGILSRKGGVGKTTLAVHLAALFARSGKTLLVDEDETRNATTWARAGAMPYKTVNMQAMAREARIHEHIVVDSRGGMDAQSMRDLYDGTDRIIVPAAPEYMTMDTLLQTVENPEGGRSEAGASADRHDHDPARA